MRIHVHAKVTLAVIGSRATRPAPTSQHAPTQADRSKTVSRGGRRVSRCLAWRRVPRHRPDGIVRAGFATELAARSCAPSPTRAGDAPASAPKAYAALALVVLVLVALKNGPMTLSHTSSTTTMTHAF